MFKNRFFSNSDMILWYYRRQQIVVHVKKDASVFLTISTDICQIIQLCREKFSNKKAGKGLLKYLSFRFTPAASS